MLKIVFLVLLGSLLWLIILGFGVALTYRGLVRGWIDHRPHCRRCRYLLVGLPPEVSYCPECGADLLMPGATQATRRRTRPQLVITGLAVIAFGLSPLILLAMPSPTAAVVKAAPAVAARSPGPGTMPSNLPASSRRAGPYRQSLDRDDRTTTALHADSSSPQRFGKPVIPDDQRALPEAYAAWTINIEDQDTAIAISREQLADLAFWQNDPNEHAAVSPLRHEIDAASPVLSEIDLGSMRPTVPVEQPAWPVSYDYRSDPTLGWDVTHIGAPFRLSPDFSGRPTASLALPSAPRPTVPQSPGWPDAAQPWRADLLGLPMPYSAVAGPGDLLFGFQAISGNALSLTGPYPPGHLMIGGDRMGTWPATTGMSNHLFGPSATAAPRPAGRPWSPTPITPSPRRGP